MRRHVGQQRSVLRPPSHRDGGAESWVKLNMSRCIVVYICSSRGVTGELTVWESNTDVFLSRTRLDVKEVHRRRSGCTTTAAAGEMVQLDFVTADV